MDIIAMLSELRSERRRLDQAIIIFERLQSDWRKRRGKSRSRMYNSIRDAGEILARQTEPEEVNEKTCRKGTPTQPKPCEARASEREAEPKKRGKQAYDLTREPNWQILEMGPEERAYVFVRPRGAIVQIRMARTLSRDELRTYVEGEVDIMRGLPSFQFAYNTKEHAPRLKWHWQFPVLLGIVDERRDFRGFTRNELERIFSQMPRRFIPSTVLR